MKNIYIHRFSWFCIALGPAVDPLHVTDGTSLASSKSTVTKKAILKLSQNVLLNRRGAPLLDFWKGQPRECAFRKKSEGKRVLMYVLPSHLNIMAQERGDPKRKTNHHKYTQDKKIYIFYNIYKMYYLIWYVHFSQDIWGLLRFSEMKHCFTVLHLNYTKNTEKKSEATGKCVTKK